MKLACSRACTPPLVNAAWYSTGACHRPHHRGIRLVMPAAAQTIHPEPRWLAAIRRDTARPAGAGLDRQGPYQCGQRCPKREERPGHGEEQHVLGHVRSERCVGDARRAGRRLPPRPRPGRPRSTTPGGRARLGPGRTGPTAGAGRASRAARRRRGAPAGARSTTAGKDHGVDAFQQDEGEVDGADQQPGRAHESQPAGGGVGRLVGTGRPSATVATTAPWRPRSRPRSPRSCRA